MVPVALGLLICLINFNGTAPMIAVQGLDDGAAPPSEDIVHHLIDAKKTLVDNIVHKFLPTPAAGFKVLAIGGDDGDVNIYSSAELYDSLTATWKATGSMSVPRTNFVAVKLLDGRVLVTGGVETSSTAAQPLATCEIYDPVTGVWNSTGSMAIPRFYHQLVVLPTGLVLVSGGYSIGSSGFFAASASELYNATTGTWTPTGSMKNGRGQFAMVSLPDGNALVAGGYNLRFELASTEVYTASTGQWSVVAPMSTMRVFLNLVALSDGKVLATGGQNATALLATSELYDPATSKWSATGSLPAALESSASALLGDGTVLLAGGATNDGIAATSEIYSEATGAWLPTGSLSTARFTVPAVALGASTVLVAGGGNATGLALASAELFNTATGAWSTTAAMSVPRIGFQLVAL
ncbi:g2421 [Coccomyxa viridis]|uniref:G2421 protein n=1 Tax=Coccomyxa viridis TaxID=1274662 RepID=A0ABP1FPA9_9CHLO